MSNSKLDKTLGEVLSEIRLGLADRIKPIFEKEVDKVRKKNGLNTMVKRRNLLQSRIEKMRDEINEIDKEISNKDGRVYDNDTTKEQKAIFEATNTETYVLSTSQAIAAKNILSRIETQNYLNYLKVERNTLTMYNLAVTAKEKRNIILSIQSRDWRSIGVDLPQLPYLEKFDVVDGKITVPNHSMLKAASRK